MVPRESNTAQGQDKAAEQPTLLQLFCDMERALDFALGRLETINAHING